jgi:hypothetical protein
MGTIKIAIGLGGIALAIAFIFLSFSKFGLPTITNFSKVAGDGLSDLSKGITDFFNSFENDKGINPDPTKQTDDEQLELYGKTLTDDEELIINYNDNPDLLTDEQKENALDIFNQQRDEDPNNDPSKFNPPNTEYNENNPYGYDDDTVKTTSWEFFSSAYADDSYFSSKSNGKKKYGNTTIQGIVKTELDTNQKFEVFSSDSSRPVRGIIRKTKRDPRLLKVDSKKNPLETASQRANRVFIETGNFADSDRGASSFKNDFDFGTNTGRGLKIATHGNTSRQRRAEKLRIAAEKASAIYGSYSNW